MVTCDSLWLPPPSARTGGDTPLSLRLRLHFLFIIFTISQTRHQHRLTHTQQQHTHTHRKCILSSIRHSPPQVPYCCLFKLSSDFWRLAFHKYPLANDPALALQGSVTARRPLGSLLSYPPWSCVLGRAPGRALTHFCTQTGRHSQGVEKEFHFRPWTGQRNRVGCGQRWFLLIDLAAPCECVCVCVFE